MTVKMATLELKKRDGISSQFFSAILCLCICYLPLTIAVIDPVIPNEGLSSPSQIDAIKNSAIWLHWNYTLDTFAVPEFFKFNHQKWKVKDMQNTSIVIAKKTGPNGTVTVSTSLPSSLRGRVTAFANNDTIMISNLQFNDTLLKFHSIVYLKAANLNPYELKPIVGLSVVGAPEFTSTPAISMEVSEGGELPVVLHFDGNPKPTAELQWSHLSAKVAMTVTKEYEFIYKASYLLKPVTADYCGRIFNVKVKNSIGKTTDVRTGVTVFLNFDNPNLRAGKPNRTCVEVEWNRKDAGSCYVIYTVNFKNATGDTIYVYTGLNTTKAIQCGIPAHVNITNLQLTMKRYATTRSKTFSASVSELPLPRPTPTTTTKAKSSANTGAIVGGVIGGLVAVVLIVLLAVFFIKKRKQGQGKYTNSGEPGLPLADKK